MTWRRQNRISAAIPLLFVALTACTPSQDSTEFGDFTREQLEKCFSSSSSPAAPQCAAEILPQIPPGTKGNQFTFTTSRTCFDIIMGCGD
jgi:hypothetical protein